MDRREFIKKIGLTGVAAYLTPAIVDVLWSASAEARGYDGQCEAMWYERLSDHNVQCLLCPKKEVLQPGSVGKCRTRVNFDGVLYTKAYENPCVLRVDPIEKGPLYHVTPGAKALALGTAGCNLRCDYCQNWQESQMSPDKTKNVYLGVSDVSTAANGKKCRAVCLTYTEPTSYHEYARRITETARPLGIITCVSTNGYINEKPLLALAKNVDAFTVTLKGWGDEMYLGTFGGHVKPVLDTLVRIKSRGNWLEVVNVVVPTLNDEPSIIRGMSKWLMRNLGPNVPLHFTRFYPAYKMRNLPQTPVKTMETAYEIAREVGLRYVYLANMPGHVANDTYCPSCRKAVVNRAGLTLINNKIKNGKCPFCSSKIPGLWSV